MCKVELLRVLVKQRLTAAVEEIFVVLERTIAEYEEELSRTKEENERQRQLLDALFNKHQQTGINKEHIYPRQQGRSSRVEEEEPHPPRVKEEEEEHSISQEEHEGLVEFPVIVKSEEDEVKGEREAEPPSGSSSQHMTTEDLAPLSESDHTTSADTEEDSKAEATHLKCSLCDKTFGKKVNLKRHVRIHTAEKRFMCSFCGKRFYHKGHFETHMRTHTGEKPFSCSVCGKSFSQKITLIAHARTHTGEKPFSCSMCGQRFTYSTNLTAHIRIHTGEKPFSCSVCGIRFARNFDLKKHVAKHTASNNAADA
ncbi:uncharacterized protein [Nerophis lumbriciformis]|uniref:uncharacterized protein n=1 Tax=Nerophis lumbriciformis TaxID=546530 RepID=UPI003BAC7364